MLNELDPQVKALLEQLGFGERYTGGYLLAFNLSSDPAN
jgi:hypothetical protein